METWDSVLNNFIKTKKAESLRKFLHSQYEEKKTVFPSKENIFKALELTAPSDLKVVIIGQDPYHGKDQATGLAFSSGNGKLPPSLLNIFKELSDDMGYDPPENGDLSKWAAQGVLLLNTVLTVESGKPLSHSSKGWEALTDSIIKEINKLSPVVFVLWGKKAQSKKKLIDFAKHEIIEGVHPSPMSAKRGFFGSKPFSKVNKLLKARGIDPIDWSL